MSETHTGWKPGKEPWCWQPKAALHRIRESFDAEHAVSSGLVVYMALTEIASDKRSHTFQTTHSYIAMRSGLSQRTVQQRIKGLTDIAVLKCDVPSLRAPATYTLLTVDAKGEQQSLPCAPKLLHNDEQPLPSVTQRSKKASLPTSEEYIQESPKNEGKKLPPISPAQQRIEWERELERTLRERSGYSNPTDYTQGGKTHKRILELDARIPELRKLMGVVA